MARSRKEKEETPAPPPSDERVAIIHLKGSPSYAAWLEGLHRKTHIAKAMIFRLAVADWASKQGYDLPPPEL